MNRTSPTLLSFVLTPIIVEKVCKTRCARIEQTDNRQNNMKLWEKSYIHLKTVIVIKKIILTLYTSFSIENSCACFRLYWLSNTHIEYTLIHGIEKDGY